MLQVCDFVTTPWCRIDTVLYTLPLGRPVHSNVISISATLQLLREDYSFKYQPLSVSRYS